MATFTHRFAHPGPIIVNTGNGSKLIPMAIIPWNELEPIGVADPLMLVLLEMILRSNSSEPVISLQALRLIETLAFLSIGTWPNATLSSWSYTLPLIGALVSGSKLLRCGAWDTSFPLNMAFHTLGDIVGRGLSLLIRVTQHLQLGCSKNSQPPQQQQQQEQRQHMMVQVICWALMSYCLSVVDVLLELTQLAVQVARQLVHWEEVKEQLPATWSYDQEVLGWYLKVVGEVAAIGCGTAKGTGSEFWPYKEAAQVAIMLLDVSGLKRLVKWRAAMEHISYSDDCNMPSLDLQCLAVTRELCDGSHL